MSQPEAPIYQDNPCLTGDCGGSGGVGSGGGSTTPTPTPTPEPTTPVTPKSTDLPPTIKDIIDQALAGQTDTVDDGTIISSTGTASGNSSVYIILILAAVGIGGYLYWRQKHNV